MQGPPRRSLVAEPETEYQDKAARRMGAAPKPGVLDDGPLTDDVELAIMTIAACRDAFRAERTYVITCIKAGLLLRDLHDCLSKMQHSARATRGTGNIISEE